MNHLHPRTKQFLALTLATALPAGLIFFRIAYTGKPTYDFLLWNLFLAWLPLLFAWFARRSAPKNRLLALVSAMAWLVFLPNAPYLITDIKHLVRGSNIPILYDVTMLFSFALLGLVMGLTSLNWMQEGVQNRLGVWPARIFSIAVITMASFGIYMGRFLRWNSWDVITNPGPIFLEIARIVHHPLANRAIWANVALLTVILLFAYCLFTILPMLSNRSLQREIS